MKGKVILPPHYESIDGYLLFLGGPIKGAPYWHNEAITIIHKIDDEINIASPSRRVAKEYLEQNPTQFKQSSNQEEWEQVDWETFYLNRAAKKDKGTILFWLANEEEHYCDRAYAQTSRFEIGEWKTKHLETGCNLVIGFDSKFSGEKYLRYRLSKECPNIPLCSSLEETCIKAIYLAKKHKS